MKALLEIIVGLVASLAMFGVGIAVTTVVLTEEPTPQPALTQSVAALWTDQPRRVNTAAQSFERLPARAAPPVKEPVKVVVDAAATTDGVVTSLDRTITASTRPADDQLAGPSPASHFRWCAERYRSYRREDDSYTPYSGGRRQCVSPYSNGLDSGQVFASASDDGHPKAALEPMLQNVSYRVDEPAASDHVRKCFSRYRSYIPKDNTYQPYNGGPRRQCR